MLAGMVQVRNPYNIEKARRQTDEYLKQLAELNSPLLDMYRQPAGSRCKAREDIPYFFAWSLLEEGHEKEGEGEGAQQEKKEPEAAPHFPVLHGQQVGDSSHDEPKEVHPAAAATGAGDIVKSSSRGVKFYLPSAGESAGDGEEEPTAPRLRPYLPLRSRRKLGLQPKIGESKPPEDVDEFAIRLLAARSEAEEDGEEGEGEELLSEYQRAFVWPDVSPADRARPIRPKHQASNIFAKDDLELLKLHKRRGLAGSSFLPARSSDHLWSLLTTDVPLPQPSPLQPAPTSRPDTDQLWELLEPDLPLPAAALPVSSSPAAEVVVADEQAWEEGGQPSPAPASSEVTGPTTDRPRTSGGGKEARRASKEAKAAAVSSKKAAVPPSSSSSLLGGRGRRKQKRVSKPFNPILMNPRYVPKLRPRDTFTSEYTARFIWPTASSLVTPL